MAHKSGFVNIIGKPNVGKSTLMNELVGERLSIITAKAQTTRHRIMGIVNGDGFQVVFSDTPGIVKPVYGLHQSMMREVRSAFTDADLLLYVTEVHDDPASAPMVDRLKRTKVPVIVVVNKTDLLPDADPAILAEKWKSVLPGAITTGVSALRRINVDMLFQTILSMLPEGPVYYPDDALTDRPERFFVSEIVREKIFLFYKQEVPYSCEVLIDSFRESDDMVRIGAIILVARESQKGIMIGHKGAMLKKTGTQARLDIEKFLGKRVFLGLQVKVAEDWRNNDRLLKKFGY